MIGGTWDCQVAEGKGRGTVEEQDCFESRVGDFYEIER
jgi:hypothetical protein